MMGWNILNFKLLSCVANVNTLYVQCFTVTGRVICWCACPRKKPWCQVVLIKNYFQVLKVLFCVFRKFVPKQIPSFIDTTLPLFVENVGIFCFFLMLSGFPLSLQKIITLWFKWTLAESGSEKQEVISETVVLHAKLSQWQSKSNWNGQKSFYGNETLIKNLLYQDVTN